MSENPFPSPELVDMSDFYRDLRISFRHDLTAAGFRFLSTEQDEEKWMGSLSVAWDDPVTEEYCSADHLIQILLPAAFPFAAPRVFPYDTDPPIRNSRHQAPESDTGALCLWPSDKAGWLPSMTADDLLVRARLWFNRYHRNDWPAEDRPPDLHLYFPTREKRPLVLIADDWLPPLQVQVGRFGIWQKDDVLAFAGAPQPGASHPPQVHQDRILPEISMAERRRDRVGIWFRLQREPLPRLTLDALLSEIDDAAQQLPGWALSHLRGLHGQKVHSSDVRATIALGYLDHTGHEQWLFLECNLGSSAKITQWSQAGALRRTAIKSFETAGVWQEALMRRTSHIAQLINNRRALIFGQGALGGTIAVLLAKAGLRDLRVVDDDSLRPGNAVRHVGGLRLVGYNKTLIVKLKAESHAPDCRIRTETTSWHPNTLRQWISETDIVVDATANTSFSLLINQLCLQEMRPAIYVAAHRKAAIGRIRIVRPGQDACLVCYEHGYRGTQDYPTIPPGDEGWFVESGCGIPTVEASAVDIDHIANWCARAILWAFREKIGEDNHILVVNDSLPHVGNQLNQPGIHWSTWKPLPGCSACGRLQG